MYTAYLLIASERLAARGVGQGLVWGMLLVTPLRGQAVEPLFGPPQP
jgi:hypothetical protein